MKKFLSIILLVALIVSMCTVVSGCSTESKLIGTWLCDEVHSGYPDIMTLNRDGTGVVDGITVNWFIEDNEITMSAYFASESHFVSFNGGILYLDEYSYHKK